MPYTVFLKACGTTCIITYCLTIFLLPSPCALLLILFVFLSSGRQRLWMGPFQCLTLNSTATPLRLTSTVMYGTACWTGSRRKPFWPWPPGALCRAATQTVRKRRSIANPLSNCRRSVDDVNAYTKPNHVVKSYC